MVERILKRYNEKVPSHYMYAVNKAMKESYTNLYVRLQALTGTAIRKYKHLLP
jgi:hypothetical protein